MVTFTGNPYTFQTHDTPSNMRLFCGRTKDVEEIVECLARRESIALFGERRIGKTLLLYCLRDLMNIEPAKRPYELIDTKLDARWGKLSKRLENACAVFVDIQEFPHQGEASRILQSLIQKACEEKGLSVKVRKKSSSLVSFFGKLSAELEKRDERLVVLIDEIEDLSRFEDAHQVLVNLRSVVQAHSERVSFILAGAEHWHREVKYGSSPLANNLHQYYLKSPDLEDITQFLIIKPLSQVLGVRITEQLTRDITEKTGGKAWFVQVICYFLWQHRDDVGTQSFERVWRLFLQDEVEEQTGAHVKSFYDRVGESTKKILKALAVSRPLGVKQLARRLGMPKGDVFGVVDDLEDLDTLRSQKGLFDIGYKRYRFADNITREWWRERAEGIPKTLPWKQAIRKVVKWSLVGVLVIVGISLYLYSHPGSGIHTAELPGCAADVWHPLSVEESERGKIWIRIRNTGAPSTPSIAATLSLGSAFIDYSIKESNIFEVAQLKPGEKKKHECDYQVHPHVLGSAVTTELMLTLDQSSTLSTFTTQRRCLPVKQHLIELEALIGVFAALVVANKEIAEVIMAAVKLISGAKGSDKSSCSG